MSSKGLAQQDVAPTDPRTSVRKEVTSFLRHGLWRCFLLKRYEDYPAGFQSEFADTDKNKYLHYGNIHAYETKTSLAIDRMTSPRTFWGLVASATTIFGIGVWEAYLLTKGKSFHIPFFVRCLYFLCVFLFVELTTGSSCFLVKRVRLLAWPPSSPLVFPDAC